jgi:hypothetical protein
MITTVKPMSVDHARALAMAHELHRLLGELNERPEHGEGSCVEHALNLMDDVIGYLEPLDEPVDYDAIEGETIGQRMSRLRLSLMEGRITQEEFWRAVDGLGPQEVRGGGRMP